MTYERLEDPAHLRAVLKAVLLVGCDLDRGILLDDVVAQACEIAGAHRGALGLLDPLTRHVEHFICVGLTDVEAREIATVAELTSIDRHAALGEVSSHPRVIELLIRGCGVRSVLAAPICVHGQLMGHLYLTETTLGEEFSDADLDAVDAFAVAAGIAISSPRWRTKGADREKIARELHDTVIQRLYGIGVALQGSLHLAEDERLRARIERAVIDLDDTVTQVRATIDELGNFPL